MSFHSYSHFQSLETLLVVDLSTPYGSIRQLGQIVILAVGTPGYWLLVRSPPRTPERGQDK